MQYIMDAATEKHMIAWVAKYYVHASADTEEVLEIADGMKRTLQAMEEQEAQGWLERGWRKFTDAIESEEISPRIY